MLPQYEASTEDIKQVHAELLEAFINTCNKHNLRWCLGYGTLLGAVREGNFIQ